MAVVSSASTSKCLQFFYKRLERFEDISNMTSFSIGKTESLAIILDFHILRWPLLLPTGLSKQLVHEAVVIHHSITRKCDSLQGDVLASFQSQIATTSHALLASLASPQMDGRRAGYLYLGKCVHRHFCLE
jgi:hypothetical protein